MRQRTFSRIFVSLRIKRNCYLLSLVFYILRVATFFTRLEVNFSFRIYVASCRVALRAHIHDTNVIYIWSTPLTSTLPAANLPFLIATVFVTSYIIKNKRICYFNNHQITREKLDKFRINSKLFLHDEWSYLSELIRT